MSTSTTSETRPAPRVVHIEGREVTLIPERKPEPEWRTRAGGWELVTEAQVVYGWVYIERGRRSGWEFIVHDPGRAVRNADDGEQHHSIMQVRRPLSETPWNEMTREQKGLAIDLGLVTLVAPAPPPPNPHGEHLQAMKAARERAAMGYDRSFDNSEWARQERIAEAEKQRSRS